MKRQDGLCVRVGEKNLPIQFDLEIACNKTQRDAMESKM